ncbi:alpha/beta hydrolase family protein [Streptomyces nitrosporeus]|uniref:alpha/beta hydrolase family protein n=1 Tax=Streptomyces nitrosporeus TaxID=28894 RepID=UPI0039A021BE
MGVPLSGLLVEPSSGTPRAVVLALHGGGVRAGYFDSRAAPGLSLLELGVKLGFTVLALDRPGYGVSAPFLPEGLKAQEQAELLRAALAGFARTHEIGSGFFVVGHSSGGQPALTMAAQDHDDNIIGLDISGLGNTPAAEDELPRDASGRMNWRRHWGAPSLYPPNAFRLCRSLLAPTPLREIEEFLRWPQTYAEIASAVRAPVRFTFGEQEPWWRFDAEAVGNLTAPLTSTRASVVVEPGAGHNISLGWTARTYHLRALAFLEQTLPGGRPGAAPPSDSGHKNPPLPDYDGISAPTSWQFLARVMNPLAAMPERAG